MTLADALSHVTKTQDKTVVMLHDYRYQDNFGGYDYGKIIALWKAWRDPERVAAMFVAMSPYAVETAIDIWNYLDLRTMEEQRLLMAEMQNKYEISNLAENLCDDEVTPVKAYIYGPLDPYIRTASSSTIGLRHNRRRKNDIAS